MDAQFSLRHSLDVPRAVKAALWVLVISPLIAAITAEVAVLIIMHPRGRIGISWPTLLRDLKEAARYVGPVGGLCGLATCWIVWQCSLWTATVCVLGTALVVAGVAAWLAGLGNGTPDAVFGAGILGYGIGVGISLWVGGRTEVREEGTQDGAV